MKMKKFVNNPEDLMPELLEGFAETHRELVALGENCMIVNSRLAEADRTTTVTQGGSDHEPAISGFVRKRMVDISTVGDVFAAPRPQARPDAIRLADKGKNVPYIVLDHAGDMLTGNLTMKKCVKKGLNMVKVATQEDIANMPRSNADDRRGLAGCTPTYKITGAAAVEGKSLEEVAATAQQFADNMAILAATVSEAIHPATGSLLANLGEGKMEIGMGQYGEGGSGRQTMRSTDKTIKIVLDGFLTSLNIREGERIMLILNGIGATTLTELFVIYRRCVSYLKGKNVRIVADYVDELLTVQEQAGFQMLVARMDDELLHRWNASCSTPYVKK